jgi:hypothetical protein
MARGAGCNNTRVVIEGSKIVAIEPKTGAVDYDLRGLQADIIAPDATGPYSHAKWPRKALTLFT